MKIYIPISRITAGIAAAIIVSATFMRQLMNVIVDTFSISITDVSLSVIPIIITLVTYFLILRRARTLGRKLFGALIMIVIIFVLAFMRIPEERIHVIEFAVLGWFAAADGNKSTYALPMQLACAFLFCAGTGIVDELVQLLLPYRVFDIHDIIFNTLGSSVGIILFNIK